MKAVPPPSPQELAYLARVGPPAPHFVGVEAGGEVLAGLGGANKGARQLVGAQAAADGQHRHGLVGQRHHVLRRELVMAHRRDTQAQLTVVVGWGVWWW